MVCRCFQFLHEIKTCYFNSGHDYFKLEMFPEYSVTLSTQSVLGPSSFSHIRSTFISKFQVFEIRYFCNLIIDQIRITRPQIMGLWQSILIFFSLSTEAIFLPLRSRVTKDVLSVEYVDAPEASTGLVRVIRTWPVAITGISCNCYWLEVKCIAAVAFITGNKVI